MQRKKEVQGSASASPRKLCRIRRSSAVQSRRGVGGVRRGSAGLGTLMRLHRPPAARPQGQLRAPVSPILRLPQRGSHSSRSAGPIAAFDEGVRSGRLREDPAQRIALQRFNRLYDDLLQYVPYGLQAVRVLMNQLHTTRAPNFCSARAERREGMPPGDLNRDP